MNPITQRSNTPAQQNGVGNRIKPGPSKPTINQETNTPDKHANDRLLFLLANMLVSGPKTRNSILTNILRVTRLPSLSKLGMPSREYSLVRQWKVLNRPIFSKWYSKQRTEAKQTVLKRAQRNTLALVMIIRCLLMSKTLWIWLLRGSCSITPISYQLVICLILFIDMD